MAIATLVFTALEDLRDPIQLIKYTGINALLGHIAKPELARLPPVLLGNSTPMKAPKWQLIALPARLGPIVSVQAPPLPLGSVKEAITVQQAVQAKPKTKLKEDTMHLLALLYRSLVHLGPMLLVQLRLAALIAKRGSIVQIHKWRLR